MKPEWNKAPAWANFLAMDDDGLWNWFENEPIRDDKYGVWERNGGRTEACSNNWKNSLEKRPQ